VLPRPLAALDPQALETGSATPESRQTTSIHLNHNGRMTVTSSSTDNFLHAVGPRTLRPAPGQPSGKRGRRQLADRQTHFKCNDCEDEVTFSRKSDLKRHERIKHSRRENRQFVCGASGCFRRQVPWSFARSDKLTSHIKTTHNLNTVFDQCPIQDCSFGPCALEALGAHIQRAHQHHEDGRAVLNATSCKALRCPIWRCGKYVNAKKLLHHVASHAKEDIEAAKPSLELLGLLVQSSPGCDVTTQVVCPICHTVSADIEQFTKHISTAHLYTPQSGGLKHIKKWRAYLSQDRPGCVFRPTGEFMPWRSSDRVYVFSENHAFACPSCPFSVDVVGGRSFEEENKISAIEEHQLSLLRPEAEVVKELYPYRMQILKLWPEFVTHPVFADFNQPQQQSRGGPPEVQPSFTGHINNDFEIPDGTAHDFGSHPVLTDLDQPQQQSNGGPSEVQPSFLGHVNDDFQIPDWTTYDFNTST
jgi:uncharacterized C2H2 Zn-finger protein